MNFDDCKSLISSRIFFHILELNRGWGCSGEKIDEGEEDKWVVWGKRERVCCCCCCYDERCSRCGLVRFWE